MAIPSIKKIPFLMISALVLSACSLQVGPLPFRPALPLSTQHEILPDPLNQLWEASLKTIFREHDLNQNGQIEPQEMPHAPQSLRELDRDQNGALSPEECHPPQDYIRQMTESFRKELKSLFASEGGGGDYPQFEQNFLHKIQTFEKSQTAPQTVPHPTPKIPVLLVPGYAEPSWYFMYGIYQTLKRDGWPVEGINLFPNFASAEEQALKVKAKAEAMLKKYGSTQINLVVHSFGGLISRYYIQALGGKTIVNELITIATPHLGTYAAYLGPGQSAIQLRPNSDFLQQLNQQGFVYPPTRYSSIWTNWDEIVLPPKHAQMPEAPQYYVPNRGHLTIMFSEKTYQAILRELNGN